MLNDVGYYGSNQKNIKRFIFRNQDEMERVFLVNIAEYYRYQNLCLCQILIYLSRKGLNIKDYCFYLPKFNVTVEAGDRCQVPFQLFQDKQYLFNMQRIDDQNMELYEQIYDKTSLNIKEDSKKEEKISSEEEQNNEKTNNLQIFEKNCEENVQLMQNFDMDENYEKKEFFSKKTKESEKTVQEALCKTKEWRWIHEKLNFSLKNAAKFVGLSKKTLDDYFLVLRLGKFYGYNFKKNLKHKIGHLRSFIRNQPIKIKGRLPKFLSSFDLVPDPDLKYITDMMQKMQNTTKNKSESNTTLSHKEDDQISVQ